MSPVSNVSSSSNPRSSGAGEPTLRQGARGPSVQVLQQALKDHGFDPGPVDGQFGPHTRAAVVAYQQAEGLTVDGIVGPQTWGSLRGVAPVQTPSPAPVGRVGSVPVTGNTFIDSVAPGAVAAARQYGVPASVTIAQAILESGWGQSSLTTRAHNLFGMKGTGPAGSVTVPTKEYLNGQWVTIQAAFKAYHNDAESIQDHGRLIATGHYYTHAMTLRNDPKAFANALTGVYATAPNYGQSLISIMNRYNLYQFDS
jgi:peptidoglycan hydrolase-like protein with peptidoglycan-binding domain